jgi:hypothetical protein
MATGSLQLAFGGLYPASLSPVASGMWIERSVMTVQMLENQRL